MYPRSSMRYDPVRPGGFVIIADYDRNLRRGGRGLRSDAHHRRAGAYRLERSYWRKTAGEAPGEPPFVLRLSASFTFGALRLPQHSREAARTLHSLCALSKDIEARF